MHPFLLHARRSIDTQYLSIDPFAILAGKEAYNTGNIDWQTNSVERAPCDSVLFMSALARISIQKRLNRIPRQLDRRSICLRLEYTLCIPYGTCRS
jgi:hypothetical protein